MNCVESAAMEMKRTESYLWRYRSDKEIMFMRNSNYIGEEKGVEHERYITGCTYLHTTQKIRTVSIGRLKWKNLTKVMKDWCKRYS